MAEKAEKTVRRTLNPRLYTIGSLDIGGGVVVKRGEIVEIPTGRAEELADFKVSQFGTQHVALVTPPAAAKIEEVTTEQKE